MGKFQLPYLICSAALGLLAARGVSHLYGKILRRIIVIRTPEGKPARLGCVPAFLSFTVVITGALMLGPWLYHQFVFTGKWVYWAAIAATAFFPVIFILAAVVRARGDISKLKQGDFFINAKRSLTKKGDDVTPAPPENILPFPPGSILLVKVAVFYELYPVRPFKVPAVYGFAHVKPFLTRPLRDALIKDDRLLLSGVRSVYSEDDGPYVLAGVAGICEGVTHEFQRRLTLSTFPALVFPGALKIHGKNGEGNIVFDAGAIRAVASPENSEVFSWNGWLRGDGIIAKEKIVARLISARLFERDKIEIIRAADKAEHIADGAKPVFADSPPPATRDPRESWFESQS